MINLLFYLVLILSILYGFIWCWRRFIKKFTFVYVADGILMFFGLPGAGKSTVLADIVRQCNLNHKKKDNLYGTGCFTNFPVRGAYEFDRCDIGCVDFRSGSISKPIICFDECSTVYNKRNFKDKKLKISDEENKFWRLHRHYKTMGVLLSQSWDDPDAMLRSISTELYYVEKCIIGRFIRIRTIDKVFKIDDNSSQPIYGYEFKKRSSRYVYAPPCWKMFDSYEAPELPQISLRRWYDLDEGQGSSEESQSDDED